LLFCSNEKIHLSKGCILKPQNKLMAFKVYNSDDREVLSFRRKVLAQWKLKMFYLLRLPSLAWWGVRVEELEDHFCVVSIPHNYRTKNPFGSIYFGALAGAAELPTGMLCLQAIVGRGDVSMLVTGMQCRFEKKAKGRIRFQCKQGKEIISTIDAVLQTDTGHELSVTSTGVNEQGEIVALFEFKWSFKRRTR